MFAAPQERPPTGGRRKRETSMLKTSPDLSTAGSLEKAILPHRYQIQAEAETTERARVKTLIEAMEAMKNPDRYFSKGVNRLLKRVEQADGLLMIDHLSSDSIFEIRQMLARGLNNFISIIRHFSTSSHSEGPAAQKNVDIYGWQNINNAVLIKWFGEVIQRLDQAIADLENQPPLLASEDEARPKPMIRLDPHELALAAAFGIIFTNSAFKDTLTTPPSVVINTQDISEVAIAQNQESQDCVSVNMYQLVELAQAALKCLGIDIKVDELITQFSGMDEQQIRDELVICLDQEAIDSLSLNSPQELVAAGMSAKEAEIYGNKYNASQIPANNPMNDDLPTRQNQRINQQPLSDGVTFEQGPTAKSSRARVSEKIKTVFSRVFRKSGSEVTRRQENSPILKLDVTIVQGDALFTDMIGSYAEGYGQSPDYLLNAKYFALPDGVAYIDAKGAVKFGPYLDSFFKTYPTIAQKIIDEAQGLLRLDEATRNAIMNGLNVNVPIAFTDFGDGTWGIAFAFQFPDGKMFVFDGQNQISLTPDTQTGDAAQLMVIGNENISLFAGTDLKVGEAVIARLKNDRVFSVIKKDGTETYLLTETEIATATKNPDGSMTANISTKKGFIAKQIPPDALIVLTPEAPLTVADASANGVGEQPAASNFDAVVSAKLDKFGEGPLTNAGSNNLVTIYHTQALIDTYKDRGGVPENPVLLDERTASYENDIMLFDAFASFAADTSNPPTLTQIHDNPDLVLQAADKNGGTIGDHILTFGESQGLGFTASQINVRDAYHARKKVIQVDNNFNGTGEGSVAISWTVIGGEVVGFVYNPDLAHQGQSEEFAPGVTDEIPAFMMDLAGSLMVDVGFQEMDNNQTHYLMHNFLTPAGEVAYSAYPY